MATNRERALATAARLLPRRAAIRRWRAVKKVCRREWLTVQAASSKALRSQRLPPPMELFRSEGLPARVADCPSCFKQGVAQPAVATADGAVPTLTRGLVITGTNASPGSKVGRGWKPSHVGTDLGNDLLSSPDADSRDLIQVVESRL